MSKSKCHSLSQWVSQWQGHLLSCSRQLKRRSWVGRSAWSSYDGLLILKGTHGTAKPWDWIIYFSSVFFLKTSLNLGSEIGWQLDRSGLSICPHPPLTDLTIWAQWSMAMTGTFRELIWHWKMEDIQVIKKLSAKPVETGIWSRSDWMVWGARLPGSTKILGLNRETLRRCQSFRKNTNKKGFLNPPF